MQATPSSSRATPPSHSNAPATASGPNGTSQPALQTTKRKFHKLLDNLTKPSPKRTHDSSFLPFSGEESPAKRIRLEARSRLDAAHNASLSTSTPQSQRTLSPQQSLRNEARARVDAQLLRSRLEAARPSSLRSRHSIESSESSKPAREPNYNPYSHTGFLRRLQTYAPVHLWSAKPPPINEVAWSRHGWVCVDTNTVACKDGCEERVVVSLRPPLKDDEGKDIEGSEDLSHEVSEELVERVEELLVKGHDENCLWRTAGVCKDDVYRLPVVRQVIWEKELKERYRGFLSAKREGAAIPHCEGVECPIDVGMLKKMLPPGFTKIKDGQSKDVDGQRPKGEHVDADALAFALMGWSLSQDSTTEYPLATCSACFRRLGLWMYTTAPRAAADAPTTRPESTRNSKPTSSFPSSLRLNLQTSHRDYCPWISADSQHMTGSLAGLSGHEVLARCIENAHRFWLRGEEGRASQLEMDGKLGKAEGGLGSHPLGGAGAGVKDLDGISRIVGIEDREGGGEAGAGSGAGGDAGNGDEAVPIPEKSKEEQADEDRARFARLRALSKTLRLKGLRLKLRGKAYN